MNVKKLLDLQSLEIFVNYLTKLESNEHFFPKQLTRARIQSYSLLILSNFINYMNVNVGGDEGLKQVGFQIIQKIISEKPIMRQSLAEHDFNSVEEFQLERMKQAKVYLEFIRHLLTSYISFEIKSNHVKNTFQSYLTNGDDFKKDLNDYLHIEPNYLFFNEIDKVHKLRQKLLNKK